MAVEGTGSIISHINPFPGSEFLTMVFFLCPGPMHYKGIWFDLNILKHRILYIFVITTIITTSLALDNTDFVFPGLDEAMNKVGNFCGCSSGIFTGSVKKKGGGGLPVLTDVKDWRLGLVFLSSDFITLLLKVVRLSGVHLNSVGQTTIQSHLYSPPSHTDGTFPEIIYHSGVTLTTPPLLNRG